MSKVDVRFGLAHTATEFAFHTVDEDLLRIVLRPAHQPQGKFAVIIWFFSKSKDFAWLSNFADSPFVIDGVRWPTVEHYYQAQKYSDPKVKNQIRKAESAAAARKTGRSRTLVLRNDWEQVKEAVMRDAVAAKFQQNDRLRQHLLATADAELVHQSTRDLYWGRTIEGEGENRLGEILMELRRQLQSGGEQTAG